MVAVLLLGACSRGSVQDALGMGKRSPDEFAVVRRAPLVVPPDFDLRPPEPGALRPNIGSTSDQARVALTGGQAEPEPSEAAQILGGAIPPAADQNTLTGRGPTHSLPGSVPAAAVADRALAAGTWSQTDGQTPAGGQTPAPGTAATATPVGSQPLTRGEQAMVQLAGGDQADPDIRRTIAEENQALADVEASLFTRIVDWRKPSTMGATVDAPAEAQRLRANQIAGQPATEGDTPTVINRRQSALQGILEGIF